MKPAYTNDYVKLRNSYRNVLYQHYYKKPYNSITITNSFIADNWERFIGLESKHGITACQFYKKYWLRMKLIQP